MSRALDVVTLTGEEYDDLIAQLSAAKTKLPIDASCWNGLAGNDAAHADTHGETDRWPAICDEARAVLSLANDATGEPAAYLWGGCLWRTDEMGRNAGTGQSNCIERKRR